MKKGVVYFLFFISACTIGPKPITYGESTCHFCSMTIVDKQHAAQLVTSKGKVFNFDALECMLNHINTIEEEKIGLLLTNTYHQPEVLTEVQTCTFLISYGIPSPMGEFLTAFQHVEDAKKAQEKHQGDLFTWDELRERFKRKDKVTHHVHHKH